MRANVKEGLQTGWHGAIEVLMFLPVGLIPGVYILGTPTVYIWLALLPVYYILGLLAARLIKPKSLGFVLFIVAALSVLVNVFVPGLGWASLFTVPIGMLLIYRGIRFVSVPWHTYFPVIWYVVGLLIYFFSATVLWFVDSFAPYLSVLNTFGIISLVTAFWYLSQSNLKKGSLPGKKEAPISSAALLQNAIWLIVLLAIVFLIAMFGRIRSGLVWMRDQVASWIEKMMQWINERAYVQPESEGDREWIEGGLGEGEAAGSNLEWLERVLLIVVIAVLVAIAIFLIIVLMKKLPVWIKGVRGWLRKAFQIEDKEEQTTYVDEKEALLDLKGWREKVSDQFKEWGKGLLVKEEKWEDLNNEERVRLLYRRWVSGFMQSGYDYREHQTPRETKADIIRWNKGAIEAPAQLVDLYEDVRYGEKKADESHVRAVREQVDVQSKKKR